MAVVCLIFVPAAAARRTIVARAPFDTQRILFIGAHPDDELLVAPLLGRYCVEGVSRCALLVVTRGENGVCELSGGCSDLAALREHEMRSAAAFFHASITQWSYPDVMTDVERVWGPDVVTRIRDAIAMEDPTLILTFDPHHGSTCHPGHRAVGALVIEAAAGRDVWLVETRADLADRYYFANGLAQATTFDARATWHYLAADASIHASQFSTALLASLAATPDAERFIFIAPVSKAGDAPDCH